MAYLKKIMASNSYLMKGQSMKYWRLLLILIMKYFLVILMAMAEVQAWLQ